MRLLSMFEDDRGLKQAIELVQILELPWSERALLCRALIDADSWWAALRCATPDDPYTSALRFRALALRCAQRWGAEQLPTLSAPLRVLQQATEQPVPAGVLEQAREEALRQRAGQEGAALAAVMAVARGCDPDIRRASQTLTEHRFEERRKQRQWACAMLELPWLPVPEDQIDALRPGLLCGDPATVARIARDRDTVAGHFIAEGDWILAMRCYPDSDTLLYALADACAYDVLPYAPRTTPWKGWKDDFIQALAKGDRDEIRSVARRCFWGWPRLPDEVMPSHEARALRVIGALRKGTPLLVAKDATLAMGNMIDGEAWLRRIVLGLLALR